MDSEDRHTQNHFLQLLKLIYHLLSFSKFLAKTITIKIVFAISSLMGKKFDLVSYLCGALSRKKTQEGSDERRSDALAAPGKSLSPPREASEEEERMNTSQPPLSDQEELQNRQPIIPPPPGRQQPGCYTRATSCHQKHTRSNSAVSKLTSSLSMRAPLTAARQSSRREDGGNRKMKLEESIWKKTIILGEKCKVPEEDDETILYDERGKRISSYHPKNNSGLLSRQTSIMDDDSVSSRRVGDQNRQELSRK